MLGNFNDEIKSAESMISELHPHHWSQIHKMVKEVSSNFRELRESQEKMMIMMWYNLLSIIVYLNMVINLNGKA